MVASGKPILRFSYGPFSRRQYISRVIDTARKIESFLPMLRTATWVAVDTEADSLHAYPEKVCLIQVSTVSGDELIDPLAPCNLDPLLDADRKSTRLNSSHLG